MKTIDQIEVCGDCIQYIANGEFYSGQEDYEKQLADRVKVNQVLVDKKQDVFLADNEEGQFSTRPCEYCKEQLAGDRYNATLVQL